MRTSALLVLMVFVGVFAVACPAPRSPHPAELPLDPGALPPHAAEVSPASGELPPDPGALPEKCEEKRPSETPNADGNSIKQGAEWTCSPDGGWNSAGVWEAGKRYGKWTFWYENGQQEIEGEFRDGKKHGKWTFWYENGQLGPRGRRRRRWTRPLESGVEREALEETKARMKRAYQRSQ